MTMNPLPPQAYTKETLQKAYTWLLTQSASVKELASSQDMLVALYLKAQRSGEASLEAPSIQNFKQELKSLANMMGDFSSNSSAHVNTLNQINVAIPSQAMPQIHNHQNTSQPQHLINALDQNSLNALSEVKNTLNLSSDAEALRALISLGFKQFKKINS